MRDRLTSIIALLLLVALVGVSYWYSVKAENELNAHLSDLNSPDFIASNVAATQFDADGVAKMKVFAARLNHYSDGHADAQLTEYYSLNPKEAQVSARADRATMNPGGELIRLFGNVQAKQAASDKAPESRIQTSQLDAWPDYQIYRTEQPVRLTRGGDMTTGVGMDFNNIDRTFALRSNVHTTLQPKTLHEAKDFEQ